MDSHTESSVHVREPSKLQIQHTDLYCDYISIEESPKVIARRYLAEIDIVTGSSS